MKEQNTVKLLLVFGIAVGVLLLLIGNGVLSRDEGESAEVSALYDERQYEAELVAKIENICKKIKGVGEISVAVTLDGSFKTVLAQNSQSNATGSGHRQEYVLIGSGSSESAIPIGYSPPEILGIGVVCTGGGDPKVRLEIISLISATFDLPSNKIYVTAS